MKRKMMLLVLVFVLIVCVACKETPKDPIIISKNDGKLQETIYGDAAPKLSEKYSAPDTVNGVFESEDITVLVDASVTVPDVRMFPVYRVYPDALTNERINMYLDYFIGDEKLYTSDAMVRTKAEVLSEIQDTLDLIAGLKVEGSEVYLEAAQHRTPEEIAEYIEWLEGDECMLVLQKEYNSAPDQVERTEVSKELVLSESSKLPGAVQFGNILGYTQDYEKFVRISASLEPYESINQNIGFNLDAAYSAKMGYYNLTFANRNHPDKCRWLAKNESIEGAKYSVSEAQALADKVVSDLGLSCAVSFVVKNDRHSNGEYIDYQFYYAPILPSGDIALECYQSYSGDYEMPWRAPYIIVGVSDKGAFAFSSYSSIRFSDCINENVPLMAFDEIWENTAEYIALSSNITHAAHDEGKEPTHSYVHINDIHLGYIKMSEKDNAGAGIVLPVFMFYGYQEDEYKDQEHSEFILDENNRTIIFDDPIVKPFFCINAIDGSIIDLSQGY